MPPRRSRRPPQNNRIKGLFADGVWQCDCEPRLPADHFRTKKEGKNHGRWFYTCQKAESERCGFFLWDEDAKPREVSAVLSNSRNEPRPTPMDQTNKHDFKTLDENPKLRSPQPYESSSSSSLATTIMESMPPRQSSFYGDSLDDEALASVDKTPLNPAKYAIRPTTTAPMTPTKRKFGDISGDTGLITPSTGGDVSRLRMSNWAGGSSTNTTPTPARYRDAMDNSNEDELFKLIDNYMLSHNINLTSEVKRGVQTLCAQSHFRNQGVVKGREIARLSVKAKEAKIAELEHRISTMQAELELERALNRHNRHQTENVGEV